MDAYDLFRKLGSGAKFDFKRFRSDAERLQLVKSAVPPKLQTQSSTENKSNPGNSSQKSNPSLQKTSSNKTEDTDSSSDDSSSDGSDSDSGSSSSEPVPQQDSIKPDLNQASSDTDESDDNDLSSDTSGSESDAELQLLGNIKAKGDEGGNTRSEERKKRKRKKKVTSAQKTADLKQEQINHVRNLHHVHVYGTDVPDPVESFDKLQAEYSIHPRIIENIEAVGYKCPTPIQIQAIPVMLHNREIMACAPTGSGKTAAFILPIMHHLKEPRNAGIRALILAPTRELAKQTCREFQRLSEGIGFKILYVDKIGQDTRRLKRAFKKMDVLVSTPNRLVFMLNQSPPLISLSCVQWLVVDESDKLFEEGKAGFRDQLGTIYKACDGNNLRRAMFSATFAYDVEEWCKLNLDNVVQVYIGARNAATHTIEQSLLFCGSETGKLLAIRDIIRKGIQPPVLVFVQSKERAKELFHELIYDGMNVDVIHADRTQLQRDNVIKSFRAGKIWILICTELMGRGIDFKGVNLVLNYDFPNSAITYIHRIGRTGRAGRTGKAITFFTEDDCVNLRSIANVMKTAGCPVPDYMLKINKPDKRDRKKLARSSLKRKHISTVTKYDLQKAKKKRRMVEEGKKKKIREQGGDPDTVLQNAAQKNKKRSTENGNADGERKRKTTGNFVKSNKFQKHNKFVKGGPKNKLRQFSQKGKKNFKQNTES